MKKTILLIFVSVLLVSCGGSDANANTSAVCSNPSFSLVELERLDGSNNIVSDSSSSWSILNIKDVSLYVEMKNDFTVSQIYSPEDAATYCTNLTLGGMTGWSRATEADLSGIRSIFKKSPEYFTVIDTGNYVTSCDTIFNFNSGVVTTSSDAAARCRLIGRSLNTGRYMCVKKY